MNRTIKTAAIAITVLVATVGTSFAGTAWMDHSTKVKESPHKWADTVGYAKEGRKVWVGDCHKGYCYIEQKKGADGWVKKSTLDWHKKDYSDADIEFCLGGPHGSFCISN